MNQPNNNNDNNNIFGIVQSTTVILEVQTGGLNQTFLNRIETEVHTLRCMRSSANFRAMALMSLFGENEVM